MTKDCNDMFEFHNFVGESIYNTSDNVANNVAQLKMQDLIEGAYYYTENGIEKAHYCEVNGVRELVTPKAEVFDPVPSYERFKALYEIELAALDLKDEKQQLKSLLRECREFFVGNKTFARDFGCTKAAIEAQQWITKIDNAIGEKN